MPRYDCEQFDTPAPMAVVELRARGNRLSGVSLLIDSGSDATFLPASCLGQLGLKVDPERRYAVGAFDGTRSECDSVQCDLVFLGRIFRGVYLILEAAYGILGRDVLNELSLVLDGPGLNWRESP